MKPIKTDWKQRAEKAEESLKIIRTSVLTKDETVSMLYAQRDNLIKDK
jgi:hypothetical protein